MLDTAPNYCSPAQCLIQTEEDKTGIMIPSNIMSVYSTFKASKPLLNQDIAKPRHHTRHHGSRDALIVDFCKRIESFAINDYNRLRVLSTETSIIA